MDLRGAGDDQAVMKLLDVITSSVVPLALKAAVELKVMDILATQYAGEQEEAPRYLSALQIASHFESSGPDSLAQVASSLDRILQLLASHGLLASSSSGPVRSDDQGHPDPCITTYALNPVSRLLVQQDASLAPYLLLNQDPAAFQSYFSLPLSLLDGQSAFSKTHGTTMMSYAQQNPTFYNTFNRAMASHTTVFMKSLLESYEGFSHASSIVDVGGGIGASLSMIVAKHPHIQGINFDLPHILASAPQYPGIEHVGGDMFDEIPKADAIFMKWVLHGWSDSDCIKILKNCYEALPSKGKIVLVDYILPDKVESGMNANIAYRMDVIMFSIDEGAKERTTQEILSISKASGFSKMQFSCTIHGCSVVELYKEP